MELLDYPQAIAECSREYLKLEQQCQSLQKEAARIELEISQPIYFDPTLKNQSQRDYARKEALSTSSVYQKALEDLDKVSYAKRSLGVELRYLREKCSVLKIAQLARLEFLSRSETPEDIRAHLAGMGLQGLFMTYAYNDLDPQNAAGKISVFVEAMLNKLKEGASQNSVWEGAISAPELCPDEFGDLEPEES
jgi:hypothetical protein